VIITGIPASAMQPVSRAIGKSACPAANRAIARGSGLRD